MAPNNEKKKIFKKLVEELDILSASIGSRLHWFSRLHWYGGVTVLLPGWIIWK